MDAPYIGFVYLVKEEEKREEEKQIKKDKKNQKTSEKNQKRNNTKIEPLSEVGVVAQVVKSAKTPSNDYHFLIRGLKRFKIRKMIQKDPYYIVGGRIS